MPGSQKGSPPPRRARWRSPAPAPRSRTRSTRSGSPNCKKSRPKVKINYQSIGSGGGIRQITEGTVDFGATDAPMSDEQIAKAAGILHMPTCLGAVVLTYNLEGSRPA